MVLSKEFLPDSRRAPYLKDISKSGDSQNLNESGDEGAKILARSLLGNRVVSHASLLKKEEIDASTAAAAVVTRVGSFLNIQRIQSDNGIRSLASNTSLGGLTNQEATGSSDNLMFPNGSHKKRNNRNQDDAEAQTTGSGQIKPNWRLRDRMRTVGVGLVMALNPGTDPPDAIKPHPCAVLQCWVDPRPISRSAAKGLIVERLEQQYAKWQLARQGRPLKYRKALDPTVDDVRELCMQLRRQAKTERVLLHFNGHGVPRPTVNGEIWVFDKKHREYIPLAVADLRQWLTTPSIVVLDCSSAGILIPFWTANLSDSPPASPPRNPDGSIDMEEQSSQWVRETIVLCACSEGEWIPMNPEYPADVFTSCLTTPIKIALRWFVRRNPSMSSLDPEMVDLIPGKANDRKTPLGELNWIFTAVTDSIAWNVLPKPLFQRLFRQDLLVASMFRNFLLADRIMRTLGCTPVSHPPLPSGISEHSLWQAWDLACETMLFQLISDGILDTSSQPSKTNASNQQDQDKNGSVGNTTTPAPQRPVFQPQATASISSPFFNEQLTAFEVWLGFTEIHKRRLEKGELEPPEQLPVVLQVLLSPVLRVRALGLLRRFLDLGAWATNLSLSLGIYPYVMKMLQSPEYKSLLVSIWASILSFDSSCRVDLLKEGAFHHFVQHLIWGVNSPVLEVARVAKERTLAAYILSAACNQYPAGQAECARLNLHGNCCALLSSYDSADNGEDATADLHLPAHFRLWLCLCIGNMVQENTPTQNEAYSSGVHTHLFKCLSDKNVEVRAAVCFALGCMIGSKPKQGSRAPSTQDLPSLAAPNQTPVGMNQQRTPQFNPASLVMSPNATGAPLQPQFTAQNFNWNTPTTQQISFQQGQQLPLQPQFAQSGTSQFLGQQMQVQQPLMQPQYVMPGQQMPGLAPMSGSPGFLVGGAPIATQGQPILNPGTFHQSPPMEPRPLKPSVYEDQQRLAMDGQLMERLAKMASDASVTVRYEAVVALARAVGKYLDAFVVVADSASSSSTSQDTKFPLPRGLNHRSLDRFRQTWEVLRFVQHEDPFPAVSQAANDIVSVVHEVVLKFKLQTEIDSEKADDSMTFHTKKLAGILAGIDEDENEDSAPPELTQSTHNITLSGQKTEARELRRVASEITTGHSSLEQAAKSLAIGAQSPGSNVTPTNYQLPESSFYKWKKDSFDVNFQSPEKEAAELDPLSPKGAARSYCESRNNKVKQQGSVLAAHYTPLIPKPPKPAKKSIEMMLLEEEAEEDTENSEEVSKRRQELKFKEQQVLRTNLRHTSILNFHSFEDYLMALCESNIVSMWDTNNGEKKVEFENGNPKSTRMTSSAWINEESSSLFLVGCNDGTVRLWGDLIGIRPDQSPKLVSSFHALRKSKDHTGQSDLICEWQQFSGTLLAGGDSPVIKCWDMEAEKEVAEIPTAAENEACVTTLTTAWDYDSLGHGPAPYKGLGKDIFVAGFSNGSLKVFDLRAHHAVTKMQTKQRRTRLPTYSEHKTWVVSTSFTGYGGRYELISGSTMGSIKLWDLRMSSSIRTIEAQRSVMTAMAVHPRVPVVATGSGAQFLKIMTLDGETLQAIRNHEAMSNLRIAPVSCLAFHKYKPILAAGATDSYIGLFGQPQQSK